MSAVLKFEKERVAINTGDYSGALDAMRADGLIIDFLNDNGAWNRCQVEAGGKYNRDGSYKIIRINCDSTLVFWINWRLQDKCSYWHSEFQKKLSRKERAALEAEIKKQLEEEQKLLLENQARVADIARKIWRKAIPAGEHGYLKAKQIGLGPCRIQESGNVLLMPIYDENKRLVNLQQIFQQDGKFQKRFLSSGRVKGCFCQIPAMPEQKIGPLLIAEGFATAMSLHEATGYEVWIALDCHNLKAVSKMARDRFPSRVIAICGDNDRPHLPNYPEQGGIGAFKAKKAAEAIAGHFALCPLWEGRDKADFNDLACDLGPERVKQEIEAALNGEAATQAIIPKDFILRPEGAEAGLYWLQTLRGGITREVRLGDPLHILGYVRTGDGKSWGLWLSWKDWDGRKHEWVLPKSMLANTKAEWLPILADMGWNCDSSYRKQIASYLENSKPVRRLRSITQAGWSNDHYALPDKFFGNGNEPMIFQGDDYQDLYQTKGNLDDWKKLAELCVGNSKLGFALSAAFAGPLLKLAGMEGALFHFKGGSSCGKTTALRAAASVWGEPQFHVRIWRATDNSLEAIASLHNDNLLILDELGEANEKTLGNTIYMLTGGQGKSRAAKDGGLRKSYRWNVVGLSSGEKSLADKLLEEGKRTMAGQETRFIEIPVSKADIANLHGKDNSSQLVSQIRNLAKSAYGVAGREFLEKLTQAEILQRTKNNLEDGLEATVNSFCPENCDGQVRRVALRFALVAFAGTLAREMGILPKDFHAEDYARDCFKEWLTQRGGSEAAEDMAILNQVQLFIEQHGQSKFQDINTPDAICPNRVGFRDEATYYCLPGTFKAEVIKGHSVQRAVEVLAKAGWLQKDGGRATRIKRIPNMGTKRVYVLQIQEAESGDVTDVTGVTENV